MMKRFYLLLAVAMMATLNVNAQNRRGDVNGDGYVDVSDVTALVSMILSSNSSVPAADVNSDGYVDVSDVTALVAIILNPVLEDHEYVDLGLSSGTLWSTTNLGAETPGEYGNYFAWGETATKTDYSWAQYKWGTEDNITKYTTSGCTLEAADDAAVKFCGAEWQMPTKVQLEELDANCTWEVYALNGKNVMKGTGPNGNCIYIPFAGIYSGTSHSVGAARLWSNTLGTSSRSAYALSMYSNDASHLLQSVIRSAGHSIRPVSTKKAVRVTGITLSSTAEELMVGETCTLTATVAPAEAWMKDIVWTSSDEEVATVDATGKVTAVGAGSCIVTATATDGSGVTATCEVIVVAGLNGHDYVDLGLPSGTLWATANMGAETAADAGDLFAWGETETKSNYSWDTYIHSEGTTMTKYTRDDNLFSLEAADDAAHVVWGSDWILPVQEAWEELISEEYCDWEQIDENGWKGYRVTSKSNGKEMFLPFTGYRSGSNAWSSEKGYYWSATRDEYVASSAIGCLLDNSGIDTERSMNRMYGMAIRPVACLKKGPVAVLRIKLSTDILTLEVGEMATVAAKIIPYTADHTTVNWSSSNTSVASINATGMVTAESLGTCILTATATDGSGVTATCTVRVVKAPDLNGHECVDLGLPSGTMWATTNVGATTAEENGDWFAWGETIGYNEGKTSFDWPYKWGNTYDTEEGTVVALTKYCSSVDGKTSLDYADDAASIHWQGNWRMPTKADWNELMSECSWQWTSRSGKEGYLLTSNRNGNTLFLPAAGERIATGYFNNDVQGHYWTSSLDEESEDCAWQCVFASSYRRTSTPDDRCNGLSVRPVILPPTGAVAVQFITLPPSSLKLEVGENSTLTATVSPANADNTAVAWSSSNTSVATVDATGKVTAVSMGSCIVTATATDGSGVSGSRTVIVNKHIELNGHDYVDLDLPSGTLWATTNIGATTAEENGDWFAWGETTGFYDGKTSFDWPYKWGYIYDTEEGTVLELSKYCSSVDGKTILDYADDAASILWQGNWRMPTKADWNELMSECSWQWTSRSGKQGYLLTSNRNGNTLFLPASGERIATGYFNNDVQGHYWTSSLDEESEDCAWQCVFASSYHRTSTPDDRCNGLSVRPVACPMDPIVVRLLALSSTTLRLVAEESAVLTATPAPSNAENTSFVWTSSDEHVATVGNDGTVTAVGEGTCTITVTVLDDSSVSATCTVVVPVSLNGHEYVDLGLPSGTLWAARNIDATSSEAIGSYFAWGETATKTDFSLSNYAFHTGASSETKFSKYVTNATYGTVDNLAALDAADDAAAVNWNGNWRMPTSNEWFELLNANYCSWEWTTTQEGTSGYRVTSLSNGNFIFLPTTGSYSSTTLNSEDKCCYWASTLYDDNNDYAYFGYFFEGTHTMSALRRSNGRVIRPVWVVPVSSITLDKSEMALTLGLSGKLTASITPADACEKSVHWSSSNPAVASVDANGMVTASNFGTAVITASALDGTGVTASCTVTVSGGLVDLGLPSGTLWATNNLGAESAEAAGNYYAWASAQTASSFGWTTYPYAAGSKTSLTKYCSSGSYGNDGYTDNLVAIEAMDDAAATALGGNWRVPTEAEWNELFDSNNCSWTSTTQNGKKGYQVKSKRNDNSIFIPAAGYKSGSSATSSYYSYWSSSLNTSSTYQAYAWHSKSSSLSGEATRELTSQERFYGMCIRPVWVNPVQSITMDYNTIVLPRLNNKTLTVNVKPEDATDKSIVWSSSDTFVATVDATGKVTAKNIGTAIITAAVKDGSGAKASVTVTVTGTASYVDLGLPSGTRWATYNIGATSEEELGDEFAWGATSGYFDGETFSWATCPFWTSGAYSSNVTFSRYVTDSKYGTEDGKYTLGSSDDAATMLWDSSWRIPTLAEWEELKDNCTWIYSQKNGIDGYTVSNNGNSIFIPCDIIEYNSFDYYWSATCLPPNNTSAYCWQFYNNVGNFHYGLSSRSRYGAAHIRPVSNTSSKVRAASITLDHSSLDINEGERATLTATLSPNNATFKTIRWTSSNTSVATVSASGDVSALKAGQCIITAFAIDGSDKIATCTVTVTKSEYVDLGLPSVTLWGTSNLGADSADEQGDYFAWGGVTGYDKTHVFSWANCPFRESGEYISNVTFSKYVTDSKYGTADDKYSLEASDDAATFILGNDWHTPSLAEWEELKNNCSWVPSQRNGVDGYTVSNNGNSIFIPCDIIEYNSFDFYWSSTHLPFSDINAYCQQFNNNMGSFKYSISSQSRCKAAHIRPVRNGSTKVSVGSISLNKTALTLDAGANATLSSTLTPTNATFKNLRWKSSDTSVATVGASGNVSAVSAGQCIIAAYTIDGSDKVATCTVTVR